MSAADERAKSYEDARARFASAVSKCRDMGFDDRLHTGPATAVIGIMGACALAAALVLDSHVLKSVDHRAVFLIGSYVVFSSYFVIYYFLDKYSSSFKDVEVDNRFYTISNLIKSGMLAAIAPFAADGLYKILVLNIWEETTIKNLGCLYAIPDFVSLLVVRKMQWSTIFHHICVCVFNYASVNNDYTEENVCRLIVVYAIFSVFAYSVNMLLASRFLGWPAHVRRVLSAAALVTYVTCCGVNWTWQVMYWTRLWEMQPWNPALILYAAAIVPIVYDDIYLNRWLMFNYNRLKPKTPPSQPAESPRVTSVGPPAGEKSKEE
eukprot:TRINITY_DN29748_c0_g1_i1.p1 TRINITY_DN29748_c0_g1~~TRINITY_DN29748_c0_g1_i1.p1  ORF type:complete len:321 (+),score=62.07 TRINITY_DN29748_c0_g1_i1:81-1043(+)